MALAVDPERIIPMIRLRFLLLAFLLGLVVGKHSVRPWRAKK
jgi:hypothetical protein